MIITNAIISFYCACTLCCGNKPIEQRITASGTKPQQGKTAATGKRNLPLGSKLTWQGKTYVLEDRMHKRYDATNIYHFDIFISNHQQAKQLGRLWQQQVTITKSVSK